MVDEVEVSEVVKLLLARMDSHPEEFQIGFNEELKTPDICSTRWGDVLRRIAPFTNEQENILLVSKARAMVLEEAHAAALDELLNGPERRAAAEQKKLEEQRKMMMNAAQVMQAFSKIGPTITGTTVTGKNAHTAVLDEIGAYDTGLKSAMKSLFGGKNDPNK